MSTIKINLVEFDPRSTYCADVTLDPERVNEIEADLQGYTFQVDEDRRSIEDQIYAKLYNITGLEVLQVSYTQS